MDSNSKNQLNGKKEVEKPTKTELKRDLRLFDDKLSSYKNKLDQKQLQVLNQIKQKFQELIYALETDETQISVPLSIFGTNNLGALEILVKYMKEELNLSIKQITKLLNKNYNTVWNTYNKSITKHKERLSYDSSSVKIPISIFSEKILGPLESLVVYMKEILDMKNSEIARLLQKSQKTIWSTYDKAKKKHG